MLYRERNDDCRKSYLEHLNQLNPETLVYVDECGVEDSLQREHGYTLKGERLPGESSGNRGERRSVIAGLCQGRILAPWIFTGYCDTEVVLGWLKQELIPKLKAGMTVIWDNASFHKHSDLKKAIESVGCKLLFLPTYSPDFNPIEHLWVELKAWLRKMRCPIVPFFTLVDVFFQQSNKVFI